MSKKCFIFFDNDGVTSSWETWSNDTVFKDDNLSLKDVNIYKWNKIDKFCRCLHEDIEICAVCVSCWRDAFDNQENVNKFIKAANIQRIKFISDPQFLNISFGTKEPDIRINLIDAYLKKYKPYDYVIIDDEFASSYDYNKFVNVIKTDYYDGFTFKHFLELKQILLQWGLADKYKQLYQNEQENIQILLSGVF